MALVSLFDDNQEAFDQGRARLADERRAWRPEATGALATAHELDRLREQLQALQGERSRLSAEVEVLRRSQRQAEEQRDSALQQRDQALQDRDRTRACLYRLRAETDVLEDALSVTSHQARLPRVPHRSRSRHHH